VPRSTRPSVRSPGGCLRCESFETFAHRTMLFNVSARVCRVDLDALSASQFKLPPQKPIYTLPARRPPNNPRPVQLDTVRGKGSDVSPPRAQEENHSKVSDAGHQGVGSITLKVHVHSHPLAQQARASNIMQLDGGSVFGRKPGSVHVYLALRSFHVGRGLLTLHEPASPLAKKAAAFAGCWR
jgi:hypothetical protein